MTRLFSEALTSSVRRCFGPAALACMLAACSSTASNLDALAESEPPDLLYNQGLALLNAGDTSEANKKFAAVDEQNPYSDYGRRSMLLAAYTNFKRGQYQDTINDAKRYVTLYPASEDAPYAYYLIGESYYRQIPDITRDQELAQLAFLSMTQLIEKYPDSEYAEDARRKLQAARDQIAGKEMQIGRYYQERREHLAAVNRFRDVVTKYQTTRHVEEALHRLTESYLALGIVPEAQTSAAILGHNFPDSPWYRDSYALLTKGGVEPAENRASWISRAFRGAAGA